MIHIERNPTRRQLTVFGVAWLVFFGILGGISRWKTGEWGMAGTLWTVGAAIPALGLVWLGTLRIVFLLASYATFPIGIVVSYLILAVVYYVVLTPIGLVLRVVGYDAMHRRFDRSAKTYWTSREPEEGAERYFKQF